MSVERDGVEAPVEPPPEGRGVRSLRERVPPSAPPREAHRHPRTDPLKLGTAPVNPIAGDYVLMGLRPLGAAPGEDG
jgi:hypothetical protein